MITAFAHGYILALGLILPLGPQNAFILSQGATQPRFARALPVVIAAGLCDTLLILLAVFGVSAAVIALPVVRIALVVGGVVFLAITGWLTWKAAPPPEPDTVGARRALPLQGPANDNWSPRRQIVFAVSVSLLNPHAILDTIGVIGTSALAYAGGARFGFTAGVLINSWLWFLGLALVGRLAGHIGVVRRWLNRVSALIMWVSAIYLASTLLTR